MAVRTAFLGSPAFAATILASLATGEFRPQFVITEPAKPVGRERVVTPTAVAERARTLGIPVYEPRTRAELDELLAAHDLDVLIVAAYGRILTPAMLERSTYGAINVHASILPRWRGASPIHAAIRAGDKATGITYMRMDAGLDTGPILTTYPLAIASTDTTTTLTARLAELAAGTITETLAQYVQGSSTPSPQPSTGVTHAPKLRREDGAVRLADISPQELDRHVRAFTPWPGTYTTEFGPRLIIRAGTLSDDTYAITDLQWEGKSAVDGETFARAYPEILTRLPKTITVGGSDSPNIRR